MSRRGVGYAPGARWSGGWCRQSAGVQRPHDRRFRDVRVPAATALERRLGAVGGFCDCEIFLNGYQFAGHLCRYEPETDELVAPKEPPPCSGVRARPTQPCTNWTRRRHR
jgi:hypothetical protein